MGVAKNLDLTTEPILYSFTVNLFKGPLKVFNHLGEGIYSPPSKEKPKIKSEGVDFIQLPISQVLPEASRGVQASLVKYT